MDDLPRTIISPKEAQNMFLTHIDNIKNDVKTLTSQYSIACRAILTKEQERDKWYNKVLAVEEYNRDLRNEVSELRAEIERLRKRPVNEPLEVCSRHCVLVKNLDQALKDAKDHG